MALQHDLFTSRDCIDFLRTMIRAQKGERGYRKRLADCAGCQPAYLSHVLAGHANLTPEHAEGLCQFWDLSTVESEYFFQLVHLKRAGTPALRARIERRMAELISTWKKQVSTFTNSDPKDFNRASVCYRSWKHSAIHLLITIPQLQDHRRLAKTLQLEVDEVEEILHELLLAGLVVSTDKGWQSTQAQIHTAQKDFFAEIHHRNWRLQALAPQRTGQRQIRFTMLHTLSRRDYAKVCALIEQLIQDARALIEPSAEETGACLLIDYFSLRTKSDP